MATGEGKGKTLMDCRERWGRASRGRRALHQGYVRLQHTLYQVPVAKLHQLCPEWDLVNEIFAEKDGGDEELRTGPVTPPTSPSALCSTARASVTALCHQELSRHLTNTPPGHPKALKTPFPISRPRRLIHSIPRSQTRSQTRRMVLERTLSGRGRQVRSGTPS